MSEALEYLIKKGSYFYRPDCAGYTSFKFDAGRYTKAQAEAEASVEPWHMKAIHQDEAPDESGADKFVAGLQEQIAHLTEETRRQREEIAGLREALKRLSELRPNIANAADAHALHLTIKAIAGRAAIGKEGETDD